LVHQEHIISFILKYDKLMNTLQQVWY